MRHLHVMVAAFAIAASGVAHAQAAKAPRPLDLTAPMTEQTTMSGSLIKPRATPWDPSLTRSIEPRGTWFGARSSFAWRQRR